LTIEDFVSTVDRMATSNEIVAALQENRAWRNELDADTQMARAELADLLARGARLRATGLTITGMAEAAGISRETAHKLLRRAGSG
jgi:transcriptional regulator of acetoin/glycerol metabolism